MTKSIQHKFLFTQKPQLVWDYLTKPELIEQWLMKNDFLPIVGHDFRFETKPLPNYDSDGIVYCKVLEVVPLKKLSYSWKGGPGKNKITLDSIVLWTLDAKENGTELSLNHSGFNEIDNSIMYTIMGDGWFKNINKIDELIKASGK